MSELGTPLATFGLVAAVLVVLVPSSAPGLLSKALVAASLIQYLSFGLARGSRTHLAFVAVALLIAWSVSPHRSLNLRRFLLWLGASLLGLVAVSAWILTGRLQDQGFTASAAIAFLEADHRVVVPSRIKQFLGDERVPSGLVYTIVSMLHYVAHGVFEFGNLYAWRSSVEPSVGMGTATVGEPLTSIYDSLGVKVASGSSLFPHQGVYRTLWGDLLADFGSTGAVVTSALVGFGIGRVYRQLVCSDSLGAAVLYSVTAPIIVAAPIFNALGGAFGFYTFLAAVATCTLLRGQRLGALGRSLGGQSRVSRDASASPRPAEF